MIKDNKLVPIIVYIDKEKKDLLQFCAEHYCMSLSEYVRLILVNHCKFKKL